MKRGEKRGQFYLIAAIIISVILIGFMAISNYLIKPGTVSLEDTRDELSIESEKVLDYGTYNSFSEGNMKELMENFSEDYINHVQQGKDSYFIFGSTGQIELVGYSQEDNVIYIDAGEGQTPVEMNAGEIASHDFNPTQENVSVQLNGSNYEFELKQGQNFYFIISEEIGGEEHVATN
jgi:hypothetical protein